MARGRTGAGRGGRAGSGVREPPYPPARVVVALDHHGWRTSSSGGRFASQASSRGRSRRGRSRRSPSCRRCPCARAGDDDAEERASEKISQQPGDEADRSTSARQAPHFSGASRNNNFPVFSRLPGPAHHQRAMCDFYSPGQCDIVFGSLRDVASLCDFSKAKDGF